MKIHSKSQPNLRFLKQGTQQPQPKAFQTKTQISTIKTEASQESSTPRYQRFGLLQKRDTIIKRLPTKMDTRPITGSRILLTPRETNSIGQAVKYLQQDTYYIAELIKSQNGETYFPKLFRDHFNMSFFSIRQCMSQMILYKPKGIQLPQTQKKCTLLFDLDETLVHCNLDLMVPVDKKLNIKIQNENLTVGVSVRPGLQQMLETLSPLFELIVFTASHGVYAKKVIFSQNQIIEYIDPKKLISHILCREQCCFTSGGLYVKDLSVIQNRQLSKIILIDNASCSYFFQLDNGIPIIPYFDNKQDKQLGQLTKFLLDLNLSEDLRDQLKNTFKNHLLLKATTPEQALELIVGKL